MATIAVDDLVVRVTFNVDEQPCIALVALVKRECPDGGSLEVEQHIEGVGTTRVKATKG